MGDGFKPAPVPDNEAERLREVEATLIQLRPGFCIIVSKILALGTYSTPSAMNRHPVARNCGLLNPQQQTFSWPSLTSGFDFRF